MNAKDFFRIGRVRISVTTEAHAISSIKEAIQNKQKGYVCISTLRTVPIANRDDKYWNVMENSLMNTPDGTPLVWCAHWWGLKQVERACGPHIFPRMLKMKDAGLKHFAPLDNYDFKAIAKMIHDSGANIVWTALRAPKQDFLNAMLVPYLNDGIVCLGVGAAFRSVIGELRQPDGFLQKIGLAGLLFKRKDSSWWDEMRWYAEHIKYLISYFFDIKRKRLMGKKYYEY